MFIAETEAVQQAGGTGANTPCVNSIQLAMNGRNGVPVVTFVGVVQLRFQLTIFTVAVNDIFQRRLR
ncbi:Uncharacterised protein [Shigella sonnei]|nr:Uncharacterised protein [Shigella sonnei]